MTVPSANLLYHGLKSILFQYFVGLPPDLHPPLLKKFLFTGFFKQNLISDDFFLAKFNRLTNFQVWIIFSNMDY